jgi:hypothetical protein
MSVVPDGENFVVPCREWAAIHLGLPITFDYRTKRNAQRAVNDPKRNTMTSLCFYAQSMFTRVCVLETLLGRIKKEALSYDFDDVSRDFGDGSDSAGDGGSVAEGAAGAETGDGIFGAESAGADSDDGGTFGAVEGTLESRE